MELEICEEGKGEIEIFKAVPETLAKMVLPTAIPIAIGSNTFTALLQEFKGNGFSAWYNRFWTKRPIVVKAKGGIPVLELRIALCNSIEGTWEKIFQPALPLHYFNLGFTPYVATRAVFNDTKEYQTFDIHFEFSFLESLGFDYKSLNDFLERVFKNQPAELSPHPYPCPGAIVDAVHAILENNYSMQGKAHLLECKVKEILLLALETVGKNELTLPIALKIADLKKLEQVKELIEAGVAQSTPVYPGNEFLCRETGLNEFKLTIGFRYLYQMTPYDYHMLLKLKLGKQLLLNPETNVEGVAFQLGYDQSSSFIKEFKKQFSYTPGWFRKNGGY